MAISKSTVERLQEHFDAICPELVQGNIYLGYDRIKGRSGALMATLRHHYDPNLHQDRPFATCGCNCLRRLTPDEVQFLESFLVEAVGREYTIQLDKFDDGILTYFLLPKPKAKPPETATENTAILAAA